MTPTSDVSFSRSPRDQDTRSLRTTQFFVVVILCTIPATVSRISAAPLPQLSDQQIDTVGERIMQHHDFRSMRRRLQNPLPASDADKGFLNTVGQTVSDLFSGMFSAVGDFFQWLFSSRQQPRNTPARQATSSAGSGPDFGGVGKLLMLIMIMVILAILVLIAALTIRARDRRLARASLPSLPGEEDLSNLSAPPGELQVSAYEQRALQFAASGNYRAAIRELLLGAMSWIERSGSIRYRRGLTNRDYLRAIWRTTEKRNAFGVIGLAFERVYFGRRDATQESYQKSLHAFQEAFREESPSPSVP